MKLKNIFLFAALAGASALPWAAAMGLAALPLATIAASAETLCSGESAEVKLDLATGTVRTPAATETLTYSTEWDGGSAVTLAANGVTLASGLTGSGTRDWTPSGIGLFTLTHTTATSGGDVVLTALFEVPVVTFTPEVIDHAQAAVYTNGVPVEKTGESYILISNATATVVYTVTEPGYFFADGTAAVTNDIDTTVNPAAAPAAPSAPAEPSVKVARPAQRYPWNGVVDVPYRLKNWPAGGAGRKVKFSVTVGATTVDGGTIVPAAGGKFTGTYAIDFKKLGFALDRGEATVKVEIVTE